MPIIKATTDTWIKRQTVNSALLDDADRLLIREGQELAVLEACGAEHNHTLCRFASEVGVFGDRGYIWEPAWEIPDDLLNLDIVLPVEHFDQTDNSSHLHGPGSRQCNLTANAMLADYLLNKRLTSMAAEGGYREPESVYGEILAKYGDTTNHQANTEALYELGIDSYFSYTLNPLELAKSITLGIPVVVGMAYKSSGHMTLVIGRDEASKVWYVHCPYGRRRGASNQWIQIGDHSGKQDIFSDSVMDQVFWDQRKTSARECGWGRIVTAVKNADGNWEPTGLAKGL